MRWKAAVAILVGYVVLTLGIALGWEVGSEYQKADTAALIERCEIAVDSAAHQLEESKETFDTIYRWLGELEKKRAQPPQTPSVIGERT